MFKKINWKNPWVITASVVLGILTVVGIVTLSFNLGQKDALEKEKLLVEQALKNTSARVSPDEHLKLLARKKVIEDLLSKI